MNAINSDIVSMLRDDARLLWRDLGAAVGVSANAAADRVRRLRRAGVITDVAALIDPAAGGRTLPALVGVHLAQGVDSDAFATGVARLEQVTEVLRLTGAPGHSPAVREIARAGLEALKAEIKALQAMAETAVAEDRQRSRALDPPAHLRLPRPLCRACGASMEI